MLRKGSGKMWWKKAGIAVLGGVLVMGAFFSGKSVGAASKTPGGVDDPLITLSYLESRLGDTKSCQKVLLRNGQTLYGGEGTTILLLGGSAAAKDGLVDMTAGSLLGDDLSLFLYHNYLVPEYGGGCTALSSCVLYVSGNYELTE